MPFEHYIQKGTQKLRLGFTTGTCAALAARAAAEMLLSGRTVGNAILATPKGIVVETPVFETARGGGSVRCAVRKDAGDDPDITAGILVYAEVSTAAQPGIAVDGGEGVGRVTRPGLDQPVGAAAINSVPRRMITEAVQDVCDSLFYEGGLSVIISIPDGARLAARTFNPKLGIEGGLSVLGTSGIVEPMSTQALIDTIGLELRALAAAGHRSVVLTPGNYGERFLKEQPFLKDAPTVKCSNYIGDALDFAVFYEYTRILFVGHLGKLVKLAGGIMNTHSSAADCRMELLTAHAALMGAGAETAAALMGAVSTDACADILEGRGLLEPVMSSLLTKIQEQLSRRTGERAAVGAVVFSNQHGLLGRTETAVELIEHMKRGNF